MNPLLVFSNGRHPIRAGGEIPETIGITDRRVCQAEASATAAAPNWQTIRFISAVDPQVSPVNQDAATYDDDGAPNQAKTSESWTLAFTAQQHRLPNGHYFPEIEALMALNAPDAVGAKAVGHFRWYDDPSGLGVIPNPDDAFEGIGTVSINRQNTANDGIGGWSVTITGQGKRTRVTNPVAIVATGATAGEPGVFTPSGASLPANLAALVGITADPDTAWTTGQYVVTGDGGHAHWSGTAWVAGDAA